LGQEGGKGPGGKRKGRGEKRSGERKGRKLGNGIGCLGKGGKRSGAGRKGRVPGSIEKGGKMGPAYIGKRGNEPRGLRERRELAWAGEGTKRRKRTVGA
jgi:hypothetical protein